MESGEAPPPLPPYYNPSYIFTPSIFPSTSVHPPSLLHKQPYQHSQQDSQIATDIDWVSFLGLGDQNPVSASVSAVTVEEKGGNDKGKVSRTKKVSRPRFAFQTRSVDDILDDGYRWRKYGRKAVKNCIYPRSYYRCTHHTCNVKKQVQRLSKDTTIVVTTYEGIHNHPCEKLMECLSPLLKQMQFLSRF